MHASIRTRQHGILRAALAGVAVEMLVLAAAVSAAEPPDKLPQVVHVAQTYNGRPFDYCLVSRRVERNFTIYRLTYPSPVVTPVPQNNTVPAEYYVPRGIRPEDPKRPAVICMHILDGDFVLVRMTCSMLASHGIPAIMFKLPYYDERGLANGPRDLAADPKLFVSALAQGVEDVRRTVDVLASRPEVDPQRIGITGISLGGIVAATSGGLEPRFHRVMPILAGGDLRTLVHHARETRELSRLIRGLSPDQREEVERAIDAVDPLRQAPDLRGRAAQGKVLMVNAAEDEVVPRACTEKLASALGIADRVVWLEGLGHYTAMAELPQVLERAVDFFGQDLAPGLRVSPPPAPVRTPLEIAASLVQQLSTLVGTEPGEGRCHFVDLAVSATPAGQPPIEARLRLIRGWGGRFRLESSLPMVGEASLGQTDYPWLVAGGKMLLKGTAGPADGPRNPLAFAQPEHLMALRMAAGAAAGIVIAPHLLGQWLTVTDGAAAGGPPAIQVVLKEEGLGGLRIELRDDRRTPQQATFDIAGVRGTITFRGWQMNTVAHPAVFDPPAGLPEREVDRDELYRVFSAMFNFAVESAQ